MTYLLTGACYLSGLGLLFAGLPNNWIQLILGTVLIISANWLGRHLTLLIDPRVAEAKAYHNRKAIDKAKKKYITENREQIGFQYFKSTFLFAGHIAAADGTICDNEKRLFDDFCSRLKLDKAQIEAAQDYFNQGCNQQFDATSAINEFIQACGDIPALCESFLQMQFSFVEASNTVIAAELHVIEALSKRLHAETTYAHALEAYRHSAVLHAENVAKKRMEQRKRERDKQRFEAEKHRQTAHLSPAQRELQLAFSILGIKPTKDKATIKRAYRTQIKRHHPDYLLANGYPESLLTEATERSVKINKAYRLLKNKLKFR